MRDKRIVVMPLILIIALSILGFAYATWSDKVVISGEVKMGSVAVGWTELTCVEKYLNETTGLKEPGEWLGKDVGKVECEMRELIEDPHTLKVGYKIAWVNITNAYPSYQVHIIFALENLGTVPVNITGVVITGGPGLTWNSTPTPGVALGALEDADGDPIINFNTIDFLHEQLDYCENLKAEIDVHFKQKALECHTYTFTVEIIAVQWNKA